MLHESAPGDGHPKRMRWDTGRHQGYLSHISHSSGSDRGGSNASERSPQMLTTRLTRLNIDSIVFYSNYSAARASKS
jgi:hypothetical protein